MNRKHCSTIFNNRRSLAVVALAFISISVAAQQKEEKPAANVTVTLAAEAADKNLIIYRPGQKLKIDDFKADADEQSSAVAATYSGVSLEMKGISRNGIVDMQVSLTIYFDRSKSWMKANGKTAAVLAHEQLHFNLTAMKACELARAIQNEKYTPENVQQKIRDLQILYTSELNALQKAYDKETSHGTILDKQAAWALKVAHGLAAGPCM